MPNSILEIYGHMAVVPYVTNKAKPVDNPSPGLLYGLELEIENSSAEWVTAGFTITDDGSLRNNGYEFVSKPMTYSVAAYCLEQFFNKNKPKEVLDKHGMPTDDSNYSDRTSIHVHTNCQNLTVEQVAVVGLLYQVYEKLLFNFISHDRDKNIFCVPWHETQLSYKILNNLSKGALDGIRRWQKYTALNLLPLQDKGTIEWRHMHGNADLTFILNWMRLIGHMFAYAAITPLEKAKQMFINLNTSSMYNHSLEIVFGKDAHLLRTLNFEQVLEEGVLEMKYSLLDLDKKKAVIPPPDVFDARVAADAEVQIQNALNRINAAQARPAPAGGFDEWRPVPRARPAVRAGQPIQGNEIRFAPPARPEVQWFVVNDNVENNR